MKEKKLCINTAKIRHYEKPIITEITIDKQRISALLNSELDFRCSEEPGLDPIDPPIKPLACDVNSNRLIVQYKTVIKESCVTYSDLLNYTFRIVESKINKLFEAFLECDKSGADHKRLVRSLLAMMEFSFFAYSASPKVNHTIRICRLISTSVDFLHAQRLPFELKHLLFKYVHDNVMQQIEKNTKSVHREIETLYLLIALSKIGKDYWLPEMALLKHFLIEKDASSHEYVRCDFMNSFSITVILSYIKDKVRYNNLRLFIERHAIAKLGSMKANCANDAEALICFLDLITCPYVSGATKAAMGDIFGLDAVSLKSLQDANDHWFTAWGDRFDLGKELDAKRSRDVY